MNEILTRVKRSSPAGRTGETFRARLKQARLDAGLSLAELGRVLSSDGIGISRYESGRSMPGIVNLAAMCRRLSVSADWLLGLPPHEPVLLHRSTRIDRVLDGDSP